MVGSLKSPAEPARLRLEPKEQNAEKISYIVSMSAILELAAEVEPLAFIVEDIGVDLFGVD